jgi:putative oxidoreductase
MNSPSSVAALLGRVLLSQIFLFSGVMKIVNWSTTAAHMEAEGMVAVPFFLAAAICIEIGGGLLVLMGWKARFAAIVLVLFLIPVTAIFHDFWKYEGAAQQNQLQHFSKNVTIMGGLSMLAAAGAGALSLDGRLVRRHSESHTATARSGLAPRPKFAEARPVPSHERM